MIVPQKGGQLKLLSLKRGFIETIVPQKFVLKIIGIIINNIITLLEVEGIYCYLPSTPLVILNYNCV